MQRTTPRVLLIGIGNLLMGDEGVGIHLVKRLSQTSLPDRLEVLDGGTGGFHLMEYFESYQNVILVDATLDGNEAGTIRLIEPRFTSDFPPAMSTHDIGLKDLLNGLQVLGRLPKIHLFVVSISGLQELSIGLSPALEKVMDELKTKVLELCNFLLLPSAEKDKISP